MSNQYPGLDSDTTNPERLGLAGAMESFEGTAFAPFIRRALEEAGISSVGYDPSKHEHANYYGFPADSLKGNSDNMVNPDTSPIVKAVEAGIESGVIEVRKPELGTVSFRRADEYPDTVNDIAFNAQLTEKLSERGMLELVDTTTGEVLAYAPKLDTDGGRSGRCLVSTNDVTASHLV